MLPVPAGRRLFPPVEVTQVKAWACARPREVGKPLARFSVRDLLHQAWAHDLNFSYSTLWRLLHEDALRPWFQRQWLFPQDPQLVEKATPVLELYHGRWQGEPLGPHDRVVCADELTNLHPCARHHRTTPPVAGQKVRYEFSHDRPHERRVYLALREVHTGYVYGEVHPASGKEPFQQMLTHYLQLARTAEVERLFVIMDNGSAHHPRTASARLTALDPRLMAVHLPNHSSWLNQIELYFSLLKRKALTPLDFPDAAALETRIYQFQHHYNQLAQPFRWKFTVAALNDYVRRLEAQGEWPPLPSLRNRAHDRKQKPLTV
jgi:transposase